MRYPALFLLLSLTLASPARAYTPDLSGLDTLPLQVASTPFVAKALSAAIEPARKEGVPLRFATAIPHVSTLDEGRWESLGDGISRWRTRVLSPGAATISFEFADYHMPAGGELWIYDDGGRAVQGPYTVQNHTPEGKLWTALVAGESAVIEARIPDAVRDGFRLQLGQVFHGDMDLFKTGLIGGSAGSCNVNVACSTGSAWTNEARSTVALVFSISGGLAACSGSLINNVAQDNTPYVLTANHCQIRSGGASPASSVVVYWRYQATSCGGATGDSSINQSGTTFITRDAATDFTLLRLNAAPVAGANAYLAGWDVTNTPPTSGVGLHHPSADIKKISRFSGALARDEVSLDATTTIKVWRVARWAEGVTEGGSSGSGLWDQDHHIVGTLSGGRSQCTVDNSDPAFPRGPTQPDFYARLDKAWTAGLKAALDPTNTGITVMCGREYGAAACTAMEVRAVLPDSTPSSGGGGGGGAMPAGLLLFLLLGLVKPTSPRPSRA